MKSLSRSIFATLVVLTLCIPVVSAAGTTDRGKIVEENEDNVCYEADVREDDEYMKKAEGLLKAGNFKAAFDAADKGPPHSCLKDRGEREFAIILKTYKKLGQKEEKAGRFHEAFNYYYYPFKNYFSNGYYRDSEKQYSQIDAHRAMLAYAKSNSGDIDVVTDAVRYFEGWEKQPPQYKEVMALAEHGGKKALAKEAKEFAAHKYDNAFEQLVQAQKWLELTKNEQPIHVRAKQRLDNLLAQTSYDAIENAMNYTNVMYLSEDDFQQGRDAARARADKLGEEAERKGDLDLADRFYALAGDDARQEAVSQKQDELEKRKEREQEQAEAKRQQRFGSDQKALEKELGF